MSFIPKDPTVSETIGSFTINMNDFPVNGIIRYLPPAGDDLASIRVEVPCSNDLKAAAAAVLDDVISNISVSATGSDETCYLTITTSSNPW